MYDTYTSAFQKNSEIFNVNTYDNQKHNYADTTHKALTNVFASLGISE